MNYSEIVNYLKRKYNAKIIILYGSFADGSNNLNSDFDVLVITNEQINTHDSSIINNIQLDAFIYNYNYLSKENFCSLVQIFDGIILLDDEQKTGANLIKNINDYISNFSIKPLSEIKENIAWCEKMLLRFNRNDCEGYYRAHWLLVDSLEFFFDIIHHYYFGPKKALKWMEKNYNNAYSIYNKALKSFDFESIEKWVTFLKSMVY
ncbi:MAG: nucleotidyltransferase domain-containing protein [Bacilli bacterium]|nr:nucleotidyltransferase domain-containing protein [Bacilli bacterium]